MKRAWLLVALCWSCGDDAKLSGLAPKAILDPPPGTTLTFDELVVGNEEADPIIVKTSNEGAVPLRVDAFLEGAWPLWISSFRQAVPPGEFGEVFLRYEPWTHSAHEATLVVETNDPQLPRAEYPVVGSAREKCHLESWPAYQRFLVEETRTVQVYNTSKVDCEIIRLDLDRGLFEILNRPDLPYILPAGQSLEVEVLHTNRTEMAGRPVRQLRIKDRDGTQIEITLEGALPVWNCLGAFPKTLEFDDTDLGVRSRKRAIIYSTCAEEAVIKSAHVGQGYYHFEVDQRQFPIVIQPFEESEVWIDYLPFSEYGDRGTLSINTNDAAHNQFRVKLEGKAVIPRLLTVPVIDFGNAVPGCTVIEEPIPLLAVGEARTVIRSLAIEGNSAFSIVGMRIDGTAIDPTPPFEIPSGSSGHLIVAYAPTAGGAHSAQLVIEHNDIPGLDILDLHGSTVAAGPTTETFVAPASTPVDLLLVVDDSCSMVEEHPRLQEALDDFLLDADLRGADYQIAVTIPDEEARDPGFPHNCRGYPFILDPSLPTREEALLCATLVGTRAKAQMTALGAATSALHRAQDPNANPNPLATFIRPEADLAVLLISDEEDQSQGTNNTLRDFLYSIRGNFRPDRLSIHALTGMEEDLLNPCPDPWLVPNTRYPPLVRETDGTLWDACADDYQPAMIGLSDALFAPRHRFDLHRQAEPTTLQVFLDGTPIAADGMNGYVFDTNNAAITMHGTAQPTPGQTVTVVYDDACR